MNKYLIIAPTEYVNVVASKAGKDWHRAMFHGADVLTRNRTSVAIAFKRKRDRDNAILWLALWGMSWPELGGRQNVPTIYPATAQENYE